MHEHGLGGVGRGSRHLRVVARMHTECAGHEHKVRSRGSLLWLGHDRSIKPRPRLRRRQKSISAATVGGEPMDTLGARGELGDGDGPRAVRCTWTRPGAPDEVRVEAPARWLEVSARVVRGPSLSQAPRKPLASPLPSPSKQARAYLAPPSAIFTLGLTIGDRIDVGRAASCPTKIRSGPSRTKRNGGPTSMRSNMLEPSVRAS